jgi:hypothetical protein
MYRGEFKVVEKERRTMGTLRTIASRLVGALALAPLAAQGALYVAAPPKPDQLHRGDPVTIEFKLDVDTSLDTFEFTPEYETFADIFQLAEDPAVAPDIASGIGLCNAGACSFFYIPAKPVSKGMVAARWRLHVTGDAPIGPFALDLNLFVNGEPVRFPESVQFNVVPEPPIWLVMIAGLAAGARARTADEPM